MSGNLDDQPSVFLSEPFSISNPSYVIFITQLKKEEEEKQTRCLRLADWLEQIKECSIESSRDIFEDEVQRLYRFAAAYYDFIEESLAVRNPLRWQSVQDIMKRQFDVMQTLLEQSSSPISCINWLQNRAKRMENTYYLVYARKQVE